jgi:peptidoglycan hydrolase-like protein with peptidoglycan-binding domain
MHRRRRIRWVFVGATVLTVLGVGTAVAVTRLENAPVAEAKPPAASATADVKKVDLAERESVSGDLGYGVEKTLTGKRQGTVTKLPAQGAVLDRGAVVYEVDARPVVLFFGELPLYRDVGLGVTDGPDVRLVEENLRDLGYSGFGAPNDKFTAGTEAAIKKWQKKLGVDQTGVIAMGDVLVTTGLLRVATVTAQLGGEGTGPVLDYTGTLRSVTASLSVGQKEIAKPGAKVTLTADGKRLAGTVASVVPAPPDNSQDPTGGSSDPTFTATITIDDLTAIGDADAGPVDVEITSGARAGVLAVPVGALLALAEGGYGVELTSGKLIAVETGLFADGLVEVSGEGLSDGMKVVTTS